MVTPTKRQSHIIEPPLPTCDEQLVLPQDGELSVDDRLTISATEYELIAKHFVSFSDNGDEDPALPGIAEPHPTPYGETGFLDEPAEREIRITQPSPPRQIIPEAENIPFPECRNLSQNGPPTGARLRELKQLRRDIQAGRSNLEHLASMGGPESTTGLVSVGLRHRYQPTIDWLIERATPEDLCLDLPPVGYYDQPPWSPAWEFLDEAGRDGDATTFVVVLAVRCGLIDETRLREPVITYEDDEILVRVPIAVSSFGGTPEPCPAPNNVEITLTEPRDGRLIRNG